MEWEGVFLRYDFDTNEEAFVDVENEYLPRRWILFGFILHKGMKLTKGQVEDWCFFKAKEGY